MPARRKPNAMKMLHGARKGTINQHESKLDGARECPSWLPPLAQEEWHRVMAEFGLLRGAH
jgi:phage terminase small subunit